MPQPGEEVLALALVEMTLLDGMEDEAALWVARFELVDHRHGGQACADQCGERQAVGLWPQQLIEPLLRQLETGQGRRLGIAAAEHGEQGIEGLMKLGQLLAKAAAGAQGNQLGKRDLAQVSGHLQWYLEVEAILAAPVVVAGFEQVQQPVQIVVIRDEGTLIGECPLTGEAHGEQIREAPRHPDPPLILRSKAVSQAKAVQPLETGLGRAEAVVVGALAPASDQLLVAEHLVATEIRGYEAAELALQLRGYVCKEARLRSLCQQVCLLFQGMEQGGEAALFTDGKDEGESLQIEQGKLEPELVAYLHAGVVDIGLHRISLLSGGCQGAGLGIYARLPPRRKRCVGECEQTRIQ